MADGHDGSRPEGDHKSKIKRVTYKPVKRGRSKLALLEIGTAEVSPYLPQTEQLEMVDQERGGEQNCPSHPERDGKQSSELGSTHVPNLRGYRPPLPEEQGQYRTRRHHECAALNVSRDYLRPATFEALTRHDAVLQGEEAQQCPVNHNRNRDRPCSARINRLRNPD